MARKIILIKVHIVQWKSIRLLGLRKWSKGDKRSNAVFQQQLFPRDDENNVETLTKMYHKYKTEYVKHLSFDSKEDKLSE